MKRRGAGIILGIASLPSDYGIGTMGREALEFADFLKIAGQKYWQILPLGATGYGDSPYQPLSCFAGNPYFIDLEMLCEEGLLEPKDFAQIDWGDNPDEIDYGKLFEKRNIVLRKAYERGYEKDVIAIDKFIAENKWVLDYGRFMALKYHFEQAPFYLWERDIMLRTDEAIKRYDELLSDDIRYWIYVQYLFMGQWKRLKKHVNSLGIKFIGDMPIYTAYDSVDVWANRELFELDEDCKPIEVAGVPPDAFTDKGQLWGNPLYRWNVMKSQDYAWWIERVRFTNEMFDVVRIDHFRGFEAYYAIPSADETAEHGVWKTACGIELFDKINASLGDVEIIAEDLGIITPEVRKLLKQTGYPGMAVLQFAFDINGESAYLPHNHMKNTVIYTGTHDNDTTAGWLSTITPEEHAFCKRYLMLTEAEGEHIGVIRGAWSSVADTAIAPIQDFLGLSSEARINTPSTSEGNWKWRLSKTALTESLANKMYILSKTYGRIQ